MWSECPDYLITKYELMRVNEDEWKPLEDNKKLSEAEIKTGDRIRLHLEKREEVRLKGDGRSHHDKGHYDEAVQSLTEAIDLHQYDHTLFSSRAAAFLGLKKWEEAAADAKHAIEL